jgi:hypothetical protein
MERPGSGRRALSAALAALVVVIPLVGCGPAPWATQATTPAPAHDRRPGSDAGLQRSVGRIDPAHAHGGCGLGSSELLVDVADGPLDAGGDQADQSVDGDDDHPQ